MTESKHTSIWSINCKGVHCEFPDAELKSCLLGPPAIVVPAGPSHTLSQSHAAYLLYKQGSKAYDIVQDLHHIVFSQMIDHLHSKLRAAHEQMNQQRRQYDMQHAQDHEQHMKEQQQWQQDTRTMTLKIAQLRHQRRDAEEGCTQLANQLVESQARVRDLEWEVKCMHSKVHVRLVKSSRDQTLAPVRLCAICCCSAAL